MREDSLQATGPRFPPTDPTCMYCSITRAEGREGSHRCRTHTLAQPARELPPSADSLSQIIAIYCKLDNL